MKKLLTVILGLGLLTSYAQKVPQSKSPRTILMEEFTNASCGPCAAANPGFNTLIDANAPRVVAIKYQTNWPGTDPMNAQNPTDAATRVSYYGVTGVPEAEMDGNVQNTHPSNITQAMITTEEAVSAPFTMTLTHNLSTNFDSIFIKCVYTATAAVTMTTPVVHVALIEQQIHFATAPGSNGETDFYEVMRKMYPSAAGTTIATSWTVGQADSISFAVALPTYIYDKSQLGVVSWIQDNSNKNVKQAVYSEPTPFKVDAALTSVTNIPFTTCATTITPTIAFKNNGSDTITHLSIRYKIDNGNIDSVVWTGSLAHTATATINLPTLTTTAGAHTFTAYVYLVNHSTDLNHKNDTVSSKFNIIGTFGSVPVTEGFEGTFPATNFILNNPDNDAYTWKKTTPGAWGAGTSSATLLFYAIAAGKYDELILPPVSLASSSIMGMSFDVAYAQYSASYIDKLEVQTSTDCGATWNSVYSKTAANLATVSAMVTTSFVPTATQWRREYVSLSSVAGQSQVMIKFKGTSGYGNNVYIDNINLDVNAGVENLKNGEISVYPNPASNLMNISNAQNADIMLYDMFGKLVYTDHNISSSYSLNVSEFAVGTYVLKVINKDKASSFKVNVVR